MHAIRFHLRAPDDARSAHQPTRPPRPAPPTRPARPAPPTRPARPAPPAQPAPEAVRDGLERGLRGPVRLEHARILVGPGTVDGVVFTLADHLFTAEAALADACAGLTGPDGPLPGWRVAHCAVDGWFAPGPHEPSHP
ncbi:hypothetical protein ACIRD3_00660 [Kitasatospora sp. NPDC093550]|uniref:hypothetical protein n=1 Tax=Kitasatospora sp. NPDC093550 TaxID=3364089 RepID=UPI0037F461DA